MTQKIVLVADDEDYWRTRLKAAAESVGCIVDVASNAREAINFFDEKKYDLIVSDNNMGARDRGLELLRAIREHGGLRGWNHDTKFVLHTGDDDPITQEKVRKQKGLFWWKNDSKSLPDLFREALA